MKSAFLSEMPPIAFAHRGFTGDGAGENSMAAFEAAVSLGYRYLETDARVSASGTAYAFHDAGLDRVTDRSGLLTALPDRDIDRARIGGRDPIPRLEDVLARWPDVFVNIDVKSDAAIDSVVAAIERSHTASRVCLAAFSDARLARLRSALPGTVTSLGPRAVSRLAATARLPGPLSRGLVRDLQGRCAQVPTRVGRVPVVNPRFVRAAHRAGVAVHVWTVNDQDEMQRLLDLGVDGIVTDRADVLRDVLRGRGQWPAGG